MALGQEGFAVVTTAAVLHPTALQQRQQQNWLQPCWKQQQQRQQEEDPERKQGMWKGKWTGRMESCPPKGMWILSCISPSPLEWGASGFDRDHLDFRLSVSCLGLLNIWLQSNSDFWQPFGNLAIWHTQEQSIKPLAWIWSYAPKSLLPPHPKSLLFVWKLEMTV